MAQQIILQKEQTQLQVAIVEHGRLAEYYLQRDDASPVNGSIYRGVVESVLPGMQAAFVNIGWDRSAYLPLEQQQPLKAGQSVVVQIQKEAVDAKGPKVSTELSIQGRTMVLLPGKYQVNISKKITGTETRQALKQMADQFLPADGNLGVIIRTAAEQCSQDELTQEFAWLCAQWESLQKNIAQVQKPGLIAVDQHQGARIIRDCVKLDDLDGIYVNDYALYEALQQQIPERNIRFKLHWREGNLLEQFQLEGEIRTIHKRQVLLKSGAMLVIDRTEAMNVVDVNTASFVGKHELQDTIVQTNLEAVQEIAWQIRLRNLSGIILIDFIDMKQPEHQDMVCKALEETLKQDRVKAKVHGISHLGLVEVTRQKVRAPLTEVMEMPCPQCKERGRVPKQ